MNTTKERWVEIPEFPKSQVSTHGRIRWRGPTGEWRIRKQSAGGKGGYPEVQLRLGSRNTTRKVHRLVALAFVPMRPGCPVVRHLDGNPANCHASNLVWGTHRENAADREKHGTVFRGELSAVSKLTEAQVQQIHEAYANGCQCGEVMRKFNISRSTAYRIRKGQSWAHTAAGAAAAKKYTRSSLTAETAVEALVELQAGTAPAVVARKYGMSESAARQIKAGKRWRCIDRQTLEVRPTKKAPTNNKLTAVDAQLIRALSSHAKKSAPGIAKLFGVSSDAVRAVIARESWADVVDLPIHG